MAAASYEELTGPVADGDPCGPDLDLAGDLDYMNFMARAEGLLPATFFSTRDGKPFDRASVDFPAEFAAAQPFLEQTRDLRLLVLLCKFHVLNRNLEGFDAGVRAIGTLLDEHWDAVHPRGEDGDLTIRMAALESLDDAPTVVLPLQFIPLATSRRFGTVTYRSHMTATGESAPREDEEQPLDSATIDKILMEAELPELVALLRVFESVHAALGRIRQVWIERAGFDQVVNLERTPQIVAKIVVLLNGVVAKRDPSAASAPSAADAQADAAEGRAPVSAGNIASSADAAAALAAVADYFARHEPSNPALLLVRQTEQLIGLSFVEVMRILVPTHMEQAAIAIGGEHFFELPVERLSSLLAASGDDANQGWDSSADSDSGDTEAAANGAAAENGGKPQMTATTRQQAFSLLEQAGAYYRTAEPSSPVALLAERARKLAERDFLSLLKDVLPESALKSLAPPS